MAKKSTSIAFDKARAGERGIYISKSGFLSNGHWLARATVFEEGSTLLKAKPNAQFTVRELPDDVVGKKVPAGRTAFRRTPLQWEKGICFVSESGARRWISSLYVNTFNLQVVYGNPSDDERDVSAGVIRFPDEKARAADQWDLLVLPFGPPEDNALADLVLRGDVSDAFLLTATAKGNPLMWLCFCALCESARSAAGVGGRDPHKEDAARSAEIHELRRSRSDAVINHLASTRAKAMSSKEAVAAALPDPEEVAEEADGYATEFAEPESEIKKIVRRATNSGTGVKLGELCKSKGCNETRVNTEYCGKHAAPGASLGTKGCAICKVNPTEKAATGKGSSVYCVDHDAPDTTPAPASRFGAAKTNGHAKPRGRSAL